MLEAAGTLQRRGHTVRQILEQFKTGYGELDGGLSLDALVNISTALGCRVRVDIETA
jgi:hypothetical protein